MVSDSLHVMLRKQISSLKSSIIVLYPRFVSVAYIDPGNFQADIQAGATSRYSLLFVLWWTGMLSIYVQVLCVRLAFNSKLTLAEAMAKVYPKRRQRYFNWMIAEFSTMITDLPTVVGVCAFVSFYSVSKSVDHCQLTSPSRLDSRSQFNILLGCPTMLECCSH